MAGENIIHGRNGIVSVYDTTVNAYRVVACLTSNSLATSLSVIESNTKCNPGVTVRIPDIFSYDLSLDGEYLDTTSVGGDSAKASHDWMLSKQMSKEVLTWKLDTGLGDTTYYGYAILSDLNLDQAADGLSTFSTTLSGSGDIVTADPKA